MNKKISIKLNNHFYRKYEFDRCINGVDFRVFTIYILFFIKITYARFLIKNLKVLIRKGGLCNIYNNGYTLGKLVKIKN